MKIAICGRAPEHPSIKLYVAMHGLGAFEFDLFLLHVECIANELSKAAA